MLKNGFRRQSSNHFALFDVEEYVTLKIEA